MKYIVIYVKLAKDFFKVFRTVLKFSHFVGVASRVGPLDFYKQFMRGNFFFWLSLNLAQSRNRLFWLFASRSEPYDCRDNWCLCVFATVP
jgi:hypothetical protein